MGMNILKLKYHLNAFLRILFLKVLFRKNLSIGLGTTFRRFFNIYIEKGAKIKIDKNCFFNHGCSLNALECISIGEGCIFGENVKIYDHNHRFSEKRRVKDQGFTTSAITIGKECWIGSNVIILRGASIGDNCIIGAGCIISDAIPSNSIITIENKLHVQKIKKFD